MFFVFFFSSRRRHTRCALVTGVQTCALPISATSTDKDTTWAAQGIAGLWYAIDPNWLVSADYRFQYTGDTKLGTNVSGATIEPDNMTHTVMLGQIGRASCRERVGQYV